jgi:hypothetical protein
LISNWWPRRSELPGFRRVHLAVELVHEFHQNREEAVVGILVAAAANGVATAVVKATPGGREGRGRVVTNRGQELDSFRGVTQKRLHHVTVFVVLIKNVYEKSILSLATRHGGDLVNISTRLI